MAEAFTITSAVHQHAAAIAGFLERHPRACC
jgi:hypothetical protein